MNKRKMLWNGLLAASLTVVLWSTSIMAEEMPEEAPPPVETGEEQQEPEGETFKVVTEEEQQAMFRAMFAKVNSRDELLNQYGSICRHIVYGENQEKNADIYYSTYEELPVYFRKEEGGIQEAYWNGRYYEELAGQRRIVLYLGEEGIQAYEELEEDLLAGSSVFEEAEAEEFQKMEQDANGLLVLRSALDLSGEQSQKYREAYGLGTGIHRYVARFDPATYLCKSGSIVWENGEEQKLLSESVFEVGQESPAEEFLQQFQAKEKGTKTLTVVLDPGTEQKAVCKIRAPKDVWLSVYMPEGYGLYEDREGTKPCSGLEREDGSKNSTVYYMKKS